MVVHRAAPWVLGVAVTLGCEGEQVVAVFDTAALVESLGQAGVTVVREGNVSQPFFGVPGVVLRVNGENVQAFEYRDDAAAQREARLVSPDGGTIGATAVSWIGPPHFYRRDRVIALYVGNAASVKAALAEVMGAPFAGR